MACYYYQGPKADVNTVSAVIDLEYMSQTYMDKLNTDFRVASVLVAPTQTTKQPLYFSNLHFRIKRMFNGTWYNRSLRMLYITHILLQYLRFCYSFCLTVQLRIINIPNVCSTPYRPTVIIRIRDYARGLKQWQF